MGVRIGNIDIGRTIVELEFQTRFNTLLINLILNNPNSGAYDQNEIQTLRRSAATEINRKYGRNMIAADEDV